MLLVELGIIYITGFFLGHLFDKYLKLPKLLGMVIGGILIGKSGLNIISESTLEYKTFLMSFALVVILIKAGLGIEEKTLRRVGRPAILLGFIPCLFEGVFVLLCGYYLLDFSLMTSGILAFIISAVSPAIVIPSMVELKEKGLGMDKGIPTMNLAATSIDDVVALSMFGVFLTAVLHDQSINVLTLLQIPLSIVLGLIAAYVLVKVFGRLVEQIDSLIIYVVVLGFSMYMKFHTVEWFAEMIMIMALGYFLMRNHKNKANEVMVYIKKTWNFAHVFLFVLIGVIVDITLATDMFWIGLVILSIGLIGRFIGVFISLIGTEFNKREKLFVGITNIPKATVQASIGGLPLAYGIIHGEEMLSLAVLSIVITAPIGLLLIRYYAPKFLNKRGVM